MWGSGGVLIFSASLEAVNGWLTNWFYSANAEDKIYGRKSQLILQNASLLKLWISLCTLHGLWTGTKHVTFCLTMDGLVSTDHEKLNTSKGLLNVNMNLAASKSTSLGNGENSLCFQNGIVWSLRRLCRSFNHELITNLGQVVHLHLTWTQQNCYSFPWSVWGWCQIIHDDLRN